MASASFTAPEVKVGDEISSSEIQDMIPEFLSVDQSQVRILKLEIYFLRTPMRLEVLFRD